MRPPAQIAGRDFSGHVFSLLAFLFCTKREMLIAMPKLFSSLYFQKKFFTKVAESLE